MLGIAFVLVVDNFGIKCNSLDHLHHLKAALEMKPAATLDIARSFCIGTSLKWNYLVKEVTCSMPSYVHKLLERLKYIMPATPQYSSNPVPNKACGSKMQLAKEEDLSPKLDTKDIKLI